MFLHCIRVENEVTLWDMIYEQCAQPCQCDHNYPESDYQLKTREWEIREKMYIEVISSTLSCCLWLSLKKKTKRIFLLEKEMTSLFWCLERNLMLLNSQLLEFLVWWILTLYKYWQPTREVGKYQCSSLFQGNSKLHFFLAVCLLLIFIPGFLSCWLCYPFLQLQADSLLQGAMLDTGITLAYLLLTESFVFIGLQFPTVFLWLSFQGFECQSSIPEGVTTNCMSYGVKAKRFPFELYISLL